jgi:hypothetical protein
MAILAIIIGILLILFGGGCTLIMGGLIISDPSGIGSDVGSVLLMLGILPLAAGILLVRWGVRKDRERRAARPPDR